MKKEILFSYFPKMTGRRYQQLIAIFDNLDNAWSSTSKDLQQMGWEETLANEFIAWRGQVDEERIAKILEHEKITCLTRDDEDYPKLLKEIYDPPFCLFVKGKLKNDGFNLAVVGTRKLSRYGQQITEEIVQPLAGQGITIISGLALGIDGVAHESTLRAGGKTVAVLGSGINQAHIFPREHIRLAEKIIEKGGAVISEYPPGTIPTRYTFPRRNRIIAGMSLGTLVIEAPAESGALITAQCALDNGREVFAVPQNITAENSLGPNNLIKNGAKLITHYQEILEALNLEEIEKFVDNKQILPDSPIEEKILGVLSKEPQHVDTICKNTRLDSPSVNATLILMEMKGKVKNLGGMSYVLGR